LEQEKHIQFAQAFKEAGIHLKAIKRLGDAASVRAALPTTALLADKFVWTTPRVRTLAVKCGFTPSSGAQRKAILKWIEDFRRKLESMDLDEDPL
jgi:hypothetical protein